MNSKTLTEARALAAHEGAAEQEHLWAAILAVHEALEAGGLPGCVLEARAPVTTPTQNCARSLSLTACAFGPKSPARSTRTKQW